MTGVPVPSEFPWGTPLLSGEESWVWSGTPEIPVSTLLRVHLVHPRKETYKRVRDWLSINSDDWRVFLYVDYVIGKVDHDSEISPSGYDVNSTPIATFLVDEPTMILLKLNFGVLNDER